MAVLDTVTEQTPQHSPLHGAHPWLALGLALLCPTTYVVALLAVSIAAFCWIFTPLASELFIWLID